MKLAALKGISFLLMSIAFAGQSHAANWVKLSENGTSKLLIDKQSILEKDQLTRAWVKVEYKKVQINSESADKTYNLSKLLWYFDCPAQKSATTQVLQYMNAETVFSAGIDVKAAEFIEPVPETDLDRAMRYVCTRAQPKKQQETKLASKPLESKPSETKAQTAKTQENAPAEAEKKPEPAAAEAKPAESKQVEAKPEEVKAAPEKAAATKPTKGNTHAAHWTYEGKEGPENWGKLQREFAACETGQNQSPVDIDATIDAPLKTLKGIQKVPAKEIVNNGHTIQANFKEGNMLLLDDTPFQMKQVHFHTPSENTIKGKPFPLEAHFVHADKKGNFAVIAVMYKEGKANAGLEKLWSQMPKEKGAPVPLNTKVTAQELMPENRDYYRFSGSLTTPPCTEGVRWLVLKTPMTVSKAQIAAFEEVLHHHNNRPVQPLNGRVVLE